AHVGAGLEAFDIGERFNERVLHQIVGQRWVVREGARKRAQARQQLDQIGFEGSEGSHDCSSSPSSILSSRSRKRFGTGSPATSPCARRKLRVIRPLWVADFPFRLPGSASFLFSTASMSSSSFPSIERAPAASAWTPRWAIQFGSTSFLAPCSALSELFS